MPERVKQILNRIRDFFRNMSKRLKIGLIVGGAAIVVLVATLVIYNATRPYVTLFTGLSSEDMTAVVSYLETAGIHDVKIRGSDTVQVRENQADRLRAEIVQQGYPTTGYVHDTYLNNISALSSQSDREQLVLYDLQDYLASTIRWFDGVSDARVVISPGEDHRYILDESVIQATATVVVQMQNGRTLTNDQVAAIQRMVANAEQGLEISNVTVEDPSGSRYTSGGDTASALDDTMRYKLALEKQVNEDRRNSILEVLVPYFGAGNVVVTVHSTVDVTHSYAELLTYYEPEWAADGSTGGKGIIGSQVWDNSSILDADAAAGGVVGTSTNTEINEYVTNPDELTGNEREWYRSGQITYDVSQETRQTEYPPGTITDVTVAIAINSARYNVQDPDKFKNIAAMAAGIDAQLANEKIAIVSYPFYQDSLAGSDTTPGEVPMIFGLPSWAVYAAIAGVALFLALLLIILLLRSKRKKKIAILIAQEKKAAEDEAAAAAAAAALAAQNADIMDVHTEETMKMRQDVRQFVEENPSIAAQMIKNWLRGGEEQ